MRRKKKIGLVILGLAAAIIVVGALLPRSFSVERRRTVKAPADKVYAVAADFSRHPEWNARKARDASMTFTYPGPTRAGKGAVYEWTSQNSGTGRCEIVEAIPNERLRLHVTLGRGGGIAQWRFTPLSGGTEVTRTFEADIPIPILGGWILLFMHPETQLGMDFETELERFAALVEAPSE